jgi:hypothetical protein
MTVPGQFWTFYGRDFKSRFRTVDTLVRREIPVTSVTHDGEPDVLPAEGEMSR